MFTSHNDVCGSSVIFGGHDDVCWSSVMFGGHDDVCWAVIFRGHDDVCWSSVKFRSHNFKFLSQQFSSFLFWCSSLWKIICLVVSICKHAFKVFKTLEHTGKVLWLLQVELFPKSKVHFKTWSPGAHGHQEQTNQNQESQRKSPLKESPS